jgi:hypothetical protein
MQIGACPVTVWKVAVKVSPGDVLKTPLKTAHLEINHGERFCIFDTLLVFVLWFCN